MSREVVVIGCGPAGLLAVHALALADYSPIIMAPAVEQSPVAPAVFVHRSIPDISSAEPDAMIDMIKLGDADTYARKVYGSPRPTSWGKFVDGYHPAWALRPIYDELWRLYSGAIQRFEVDPLLAEVIADTYPLVINTAPAAALCQNRRHAFPSRWIWIRNDAPASVAPGSMVYNGRDDPWYRASDLFGVRSTEYARLPHHISERDRSRGLKVLDTDCDCHPTVVRAGRWGEWRSGVLLHHAFEKAEMVVNAQSILEEHI